MAIETFSLPATSLPYPAVTVCKAQKYDVAEYLVAVFDNFEFPARSTRAARGQPS